MIPSDYDIDNNLDNVKVTVGNVISVSNKLTEYEFYIDNKKYKGYFNGKNTFLADKGENIIISYNSKTPEINQPKNLYLSDKLGCFLVYFFLWIAGIIFSAIVSLFIYFYNIKYN